MRNRFALAAGLVMLALSTTRSSAADVVLYGTDASTIHGNWTFVADSSAAGGKKLSSADYGSSVADAPLAAPDDYFEATFTADAATPYHVWLRLRATADSKWNDSVWVQFTDAVDRNGSAIYRTGTTNGLAVNLEAGSGCGDSGWGWQDRAWWIGQSSIVQFPSSGPHTIRIQTREDGVQIDQIVLSATTFLSSAPGTATNDTTIVSQIPSAPTVPSASTPFTGTPAAIPGTIQAEKFDNGGQGIAYFDTTAGNSGGGYRQGDVDLEAASPGGYDVGWVAPGEWLNYTVDVAAAGSYVAQFSVASLGQGGAFHLEMNGANVTGSITIPDTGGWQNWRTISAAVNLAAGPQVARLVMETWGAYAVGNFDYVTFAAGQTSTPTASTPFTGTPAAIPGTIQAENFDNGGQGIAYFDTTAGNSGGGYRQGDVDLEAASPGGYDVGWVAPGEWLSYTVDVAAAGSYVAQFSVASLGQGGAFHLEMNGANVTGSITIPDTGGWQNWRTISAAVNLAAGPQVARLVMETWGAYAVGNFDSIAFSASGSGGPAPTVPRFSRVYVIVMENREFSDIIGNASAPYLNSLASQYALATAYTGVTHPSLPDYMAITGGNTYFTEDCVGCTVSAPNIADQIEAAGLTWKAYMESMPAACSTVDSGAYATRHNPFVHYVDIVSNPARCAAHDVPLTQFSTDVSSGSLPNFVWITPDLCSDMHDCSVATGDAWLASFVPQIQRMPDFATSVLFIVWDEGTSDIGGGGLVPLLVVSPLARSGFRSTTPENHYNLLRTIEDAWALPHLGQAAGAAPMTEYFSAP